MKMFVHISLDNELEIKDFCRRFAGEMPAEPERPAERKEAPVEKPEQSVEKKAEAPAEKKDAEKPDRISEEEAVSLRIACEKFCAADKEGKKKIQQFLKDKGIARITAMPVSCLADFQAMVAG